MFEVLIGCLSPLTLVSFVLWAALLVWAVLSIGLAFATVFDPAQSEAMETIETNKDKKEDDESGGSKEGGPAEEGAASSADGGQA